MMVLDAVCSNVKGCEFHYTIIQDVVADVEQTTNLRYFSSSKD